MQPVQPIGAHCDGSGIVRHVEERVGPVVSAKRGCVVAGASDRVN